MTQEPAPDSAHRPQGHTETILHGVTLTDDYAWLREKENPEVTAYLEAENAYAEAVMAPLAGLREELYQEMLSHMKQTDVSVPFRDGDWWYYTRTEEGQQYAIHCRKRGERRLGPRMPNATTEEVILDGNQLAEGHAFFSIGATDITDDGRWLAYTTDTPASANTRCTSRISKPAKPCPAEVERVGSVVWAADNSTLFYTVEDEEQKRQYQLWRHTLGTPHSDDVLVYQDDDERFNLGAGRTRDGSFLVLESASHTTSESWVLAADKPNGAVHAHQPRAKTSMNTPSTIATACGSSAPTTGAETSASSPLRWPRPAASIGPSSFPTATDVMLEDVDLFAELLRRLRTRRRPAAPAHLALSRRRARGDATAGEIAFPEPAYSAHPHINRIFDTRTFATPTSRWSRPALSTSTTSPPASSTLLKQLEIPGGFDRTLYASERVHATAPDGVQVPVSLVYRKDRREAGKNPALRLRLRLLWLLAAARLQRQPPQPARSRRGHGLCAHSRRRRSGQALARCGKMLVKRNTFTDFIAAVEHLTAAGYGDPARVAIEGGSAGGLLMGAVVNLRPDLFRAVVSHVPFVDVMNTMLDATLPLTVPEYEEWGNPNEEDLFPLHAELLALRQPEAGELSGHASQDVAPRQPGDVLGAGQVCGQAPHSENR